MRFALLSARTSCSAANFVTPDQDAGLGTWVSGKVASYPQMEEVPILKNV